MVEAPIVVSACDPHTTFLAWLHEPPASARQLVARWRAKPRPDGYESKIDAVIATLPVYDQLDPTLPDRLGFDPLHATAIISPTVAAMAAAHRYERREGRRSAHVLRQHPLGVGPVAAGGRRRSRPPRLQPGDPLHPLRPSGGLATSREPERWLSVYAERVRLGFLDGVERWRAMTPDVYERDFFMPRGYATSFAGGPLAALRGKDRELTRYETPVQGLYLTGAATFPGAGVWGASGRSRRGSSSPADQPPDRSDRTGPTAGQASLTTASPWRTAIGAWSLQGKLIHRSVRRQTYSHCTTDRGFS